MYRGVVSQTLDNEDLPKKNFIARGVEIRPMPAEAGSEIGSNLVDLFSLLSEMVRELAEETPGAGSAAAILQSSSELDGDWTRQLGTDLCVSVLVSTLSAFDHGRQIGRALEDSSGVSSLVTLARGCLESMARAHWIISAQDADEAAARWLSLLHKEI